MQYTATYSPEDNKIRLYASQRLDAETYARVKGAGFGWAPKQECFYAVWTPGREDLAIELAGELEDEDKSLVERAEERAERFQEYREKRAADAERAHNAVAAIADNIPLGQPILVGHHSQRHAEKHAEKIKSGMERAVKMWETSKYWQSRAAGAIAHAKYKEEPDVRYRRIKGLESDLRKQEKAKSEAEASIKIWSTLHEHHRMPKKSGEPSTFAERAIFIAGNTRTAPFGTYTALRDGKITPEQAQEQAIKQANGTIAWAERWITHFTNRIAYERAMLQESGNIAAAKFDLQVGGRVLVSGIWSTIMRLNKKAGQVVSVSTNTNRYPRVPTLEQITDYQPPTAEAAEKATAATKLPPLCNYKHETFVEMTKAEWERINSDYKATRVIGKDAPGDKYNRVDKTPFEVYGPHRVRSCIAGAAPRKPEGANHHGLVLVYITDLKTTPPPMPHQVAPMPEKLPAPERAAEAPARVWTPPEPTKFDALKDALKTGVQVVSTPQLFPTPPDLAERMVDESCVRRGMRVLEPSAGTGRLLDALFAKIGPYTLDDERDVTAYEINPTLAGQLQARYPNVFVQALDFLTYPPTAALPFDVVLMNPPFANGDDIKHIEHAAKFLKPGGTLVAICAGGPRQKQRLEPLVTAYGGIWEPLPAGTFESSGTGVSTVLLSFTVPVDEMVEG